MNKQQALERVVELSADMKTRLTELRRLYSTLGPIVGEEHDGVAGGNMGVVERCQERKTAVTNAVEKEFSALQESCRQISELHEQYCGSQETGRTVTLKQTLGFIADLSRALPSGNLANQLVDYQLRGVEDLLQSFDAQVKKVQPLLEMNMYIVSNMLANIQQSYKFHMSIAEEESSAYTDKGVKKADGSHSGFKIGV